MKKYEVILVGQDSASWRGIVSAPCEKTAVAKARALIKLDKIGNVTAEDRLGKITGFKVKIFKNKP